MQGKDSLSFSIVDEDEFNFDEEMPVQNAREIPSPQMKRNQPRNVFTLPQKGSVQLLSDSEEDNLDLSPKRFSNEENEFFSEEEISEEDISENSSSNMFKNTPRQILSPPQKDVVRFLSDLEEEGPKRSLYEEKEFISDEEMSEEEISEISNSNMLRNTPRNILTPPKKDTIKFLSDSEEEAPKRLSKETIKPPANQASLSLNQQGRIPSAGPSGRNTITKIRSPTFGDRHALESSESDSEDTDNKKKRPLPGEYDPAQFEDLDVTEDIKDLFQYISKYTPQNLSLDYKFKPFIPDFIPAVGDIDAFLKVLPPEQTISGEMTKIDLNHLGLTVLDEPAANQSDPALLHLQLRATSVNVSHTTNMVVKKVDNIEKHGKVINKWIKDISDLHRTKSSPVVKFSDPMPDLDDLMQEWPEKMENLLKTQGFPSFHLRGALADYVDIVCCIFDIPVYKRRIQSLYLLFSLFAAIKNSQLYKAANTDKDGTVSTSNVNTDQLVLD